MSEQTPAANEQHQQEPVADTSQETGTPEVNPWEERYKEAQAWGTRNAQRVAELEPEAAIVQALRSENPDEYNQALRELGFNIPEPEYEEQLPYELDPEVAALRADVDEVKQWRSQLTEAQAQEQDYAEYRELTDPQLKEMGVPEGLYDIVAEAALNLPPLETPQGRFPDLQGAYQQVEAMAEVFASIPAVQNAVKQAWKNTKPSSALTSPNGVQATHTPTLDTEEQRRDYARQLVAQLEADEQAGA